MITWWQARSSREQLIIALAGVVFVALLAHQGLYRPLSAFHAEARIAQSDAASYLADVQNAARSIAATRSSAVDRAPLPEGGLRAAATAAAIEVGVTISRLQPIEGEAVEFWIDAAPSQQVFRWLAKLHQTHGVRVVRADLRSTEESQNIRAQFALSVESQQ